jgi:hypothetical protein
MTAGYVSVSPEKCLTSSRRASTFSRHTAPEFCKFVRPKKRGRREDRVRAAPAVSCANRQTKTHTSIQVQRKQSGLPCAMVLQLIPCSPRRDQSLFVTVVPKKLELLANLTPAIGVSGPHDFAVRVSRARQSQPSRPPHPTARFVTCATPLSSGRTAQNTQLIWVKNKAEYFRSGYWTQRWCIRLGGQHTGSGWTDEVKRSSVL